MAWFVHHDDKILGPFSTQQILKDLKAGEISYGAYVWSKGQVEWVPISDWETNLDSLLSLADTSNQKWKLRNSDEIWENLTFEDVVGHLKTMDNYARVMVSPQSPTQWTPLYSSYPFMEALNLSRRSFLRAPLMGLAKVTKTGSRFSYVVKTATIGQGGIGVYGLGPNFEAGTQVSVRVESEDMNSTITINGTVVYNTDKGFVGIRFGELPSESVAIIIEYIKKFQEDEGISQKAA